MPRFIKIVISYFLRSTIVIACSWLPSAWAAELAAPDWAEVASAKLNEQRGLLESWAYKVKQARQANPNWKPDENWRVFLAQLARTPLDHPELRVAAASLFGSIGEISDECFAFCDSWTKCKEGDPESNGNGPIRLLMAMNSKGPRARDFVIGISKSLKDPQYAYDLLGKSYGEDPIVKSLILADLESPDPVRKKAAHYNLVSLKLEKADATALLKYFIKLASTEKATNEIEAFAASLMMIVQKSPALFRKSLDAPEADALLKVAEANENLRIAAMANLLIGSNSLPDQFPSFLLRLKSDQQRSPGREMLTAFGFLPPQRVNVDRKQLVEKAKTTYGEGRAGLFSIFWRSIGDFDKALAEWREALGRNWFPDQEYWEGLNNQESRGPVAPQFWQKEWEDSSSPAKLPPNLPEVERRKFRDSIRRNLVWSIVSAADAPDAAWIFSKAIKDEGLQQDVLLTLWRLREESAKCKLDENVKTWLQMQASATDAQQAIIPAGIIYFAYGEKNSCTSAIDKLRNQEVFSGGHWPPLVDILLKLDPGDKWLDTYRERLSGVKGGQWLIWLLDLKRQRSKEMPVVPVESLADALRVARGSSPQWLNAFRSTGDPIFPYFDSLRDPYVLIAGSDQSLGAVLHFLGALDRLEISKLKAAQAKP